MATTLIFAIAVLFIDGVLGGSGEICVAQNSTDNYYYCEDGLQCCENNKCCERELISPKHVLLVVLIVLICIATSAFSLIVYYLCSCSRSDFEYQAIPGEVVTSQRGGMVILHHNQRATSEIRSQNSLYPIINHSYQREYHSISSNR